MNRNRKLLMVAALAAVVLVLGPMLGCSKSRGPTTGGPAYYQGKTITIVVHAGAGGSTDIFHRVLARHLGKYIPGNPSIVVRNMTAGGGIVGSNYVYKQAKPDGLTTLGTSVTAWTLNFLRPEGVEFKLADMPAILNSSEGAVIFVKPNMVKEPKDLLKDGLIFGTIGPTAGHGSGMLAAADLLDLKLKWVWGYKGSAEERLAFFAGETNMFAASVATWNSMKTQAEKGEVAAIMQTGILDAKGNVIRDPGIPNIKTVGDVYQELYGKAPSGTKWEAFKGIYVAARVAARTLYLPPGTPADIVKILDKAAHEMGKDPEYNAEFEKLFGKGELFFPQDAPDVWKVITSPAPEVRDAAKRLVAPHGITLQ